MNRSNRLWLLVTLAAVSACRDLQYPEGIDAQNQPPEVEFLLPADGAVTALNPVVSLDVRDPNGIASVTLLCGNLPVYVWAAPPFLASVDLTACPGATDPNTGRRQVTLRALARDLPGLESPPKERSLFLDVATAQLQVSGPDRVAPGGRYVLRIVSDRTLGAVPTARIGSLSAQLSDQTAPGQPPLTVFDAIFDPMPGIGAELLDGGTPTQAQLEEMERSFVVEVEGRATSGNVTRVVREVTVSRIAWQRPLPITYQRMPWPYSDADDPVATAQGLVLPFDVYFANGYWLPGTLAHEDGAFIPFEDEGRLLETGYAAEGMDSEGRAFFTRPDAGTVVEYAFTSPTGDPLGGGVLPSRPNEDLRRVGSSLCGGYTADAGTCFGPSPSSARAVVCLSPEGKTALPAVPDPTEVARYSSFGWAVSGDTYATWGFGSSGCAFDYAIALASPTQGALATPTDAGVSYGLDQLFPLGAGRFFGTYYQHVNGEYVSYVVNPDGTVGGRFFTAQALAHLGLPAGVGLPPEYVIGTMLTTPPRVITRRHGVQQTVFEAWEENVDAPVGSFSITGYVLSPFADGTRYGQVFTSPDGTLYLQLVLSLPEFDSKAPVVSAKPIGRDLLVALDRHLRPKWMYRFATTASGLLYANASTSHLYYVDTASQRVIAFTR